MEPGQRGRLVRGSWHRWIPALPAAAAFVLAVGATGAQPQLDRPATIEGRPDFNGI
jgi:hypothetical protein